jgi:hypothetical protein
MLMRFVESGGGEMRKSLAIFRQFLKNIMET